MPLKMTMESQEWLMIGDTRVINVHPLQARFSIEGAAPILRQAFVMDETLADNAAKRAYLVVQRLYLGVSQDMTEYQKAVGELLAAEPASKEVVLKANMQMAKGSLYGALREYRKLVDTKAP
jgi:flagellar protein FlbT